MVRTGNLGGRAAANRSADCRLGHQSIYARVRRLGRSGPICPYL